MQQGKYLNQEAPVKKKVKAGTIVFYSFYFLFIIAFFAALLIGMNALRDWLVRFEASQPGHKCQEVFDALFGDPDWAEIYRLAGIEDTKFEGADAFSAYMEQQVGDAELTYLETSAGLSGNKKYIVKLGDEKIAGFTLTGEEDTETGIPNWQLGEVEVIYSRDHSVTVEKLPGQTVCINGVALDDSYTIRTVSTVAEAYLPEGVHGYRLEQQQVTGLLVVPEVTVTDEAGNTTVMTADSETGIYSIAKEEMTATEAEKQLALNAVQAYAKYMIRAVDISAVRACFDTGSEIYEVIRKYEAWTMQSYASYEFTQAAYSDYYRYSDTLFSIRVALDLNVKRYGGSIKTYELNTTLFLSKNDAGTWLVTDMTNADVQEIVEHVRLTFMDGDTLLTSFLAESDAAQLALPEVQVPDGKVFLGWVVRENNGDGQITLTLVFENKGSQTVYLPSGGSLEPMTLYTHFEEAGE